MRQSILPGFNVPCCPLIKFYSSYIINHDCMAVKKNILRYLLHQTCEYLIYSYLMSDGPRATERIELFTESRWKCYCRWTKSQTLKDR